MRSFFEGITSHPISVIVAVLAVTAVFAYGLKDIRTEADVENMLPEGHPSVEHAKRVRDIFELEESLVIALTHEGKGGIYTKEVLRLVQGIGEGLKDIRGIDGTKIVSLFTAESIVGDEGGFSVAPLCEEIPASPREMEELARRVKASPLFDGTLVSRDGSGTLILAPVTAASDKGRVYRDVVHLLASLKHPGVAFYVTGNPVVQGVLGEHVEKDMGKMMPLVSLVIVLALLILFRSLRGVVLPLAVVLFSVIWAMGLMAYLDIPIYPMTTIVPIVIMAIGVADGIHIIARYYEEAAARPGRSASQITVETMMEMASPVVMTSLTTAVGFLSLLTSRMKPIFHTGVFTAFGVMAAMVFSLTLIPAVLSLMPVPAPRRSRRWWTQADQVFQRIGTFVYRRRGAVILGTCGLAILSLVGLTRLNVDSDPMSNFNPSDPIPISTRVINRLFSGAMMIHTTLEAEEERQFLEPDILRAVDDFQKEVGEIPLVGTTFSAVDLLKMMHQAMMEQDPTQRIVPPTRNLVATYLMLYSGDDINHYINYGRDMLNIETRVVTTSTKVLEGVLEKMDDAAERHFGSFPGVRVTVGGYGRVLVDLINIIVYGQITSILLSIAGVFLITALMFRSPVAGLFNIIPIGLATALNFGIMGLARVPLEPATAITSCIGIGVGIDYAIHFIAKYRLTRRRGLEGAAVVENSMATAGKAIFFNATVVIGGFLVLVASSFPPSRHMGVMISLNMFTSFVAAVTILPALLAKTDPLFTRRPQLRRPR